MCPNNRRIAGEVKIDERPNTEKTSRLPIEISLFSWKHISMNILFYVIWLKKFLKIQFLNLTFHPFFFSHLNKNILIFYLFIKITIFFKIYMQIFEMIKDIYVKNELFFTKKYEND